MYFLANHLYNEKGYLQNVHVKWTQSKGAYASGLAKRCERHTRAHALPQGQAVESVLLNVVAKAEGLFVRVKRKAPAEQSL